MRPGGSDADTGVGLWVQPTEMLVSPAGLASPLKYPVLVPRTDSRGQGSLKREM
jgi:hypothetical protein